ncbi:MAG TPA: SnoaL-like domain-containing protein [Dehalococcoidia bacterium]|nr:SnoaL-like domain-containing protein [Dehalococcoidia bacterium]
MKGKVLAIVMLLALLASLSVACSSGVSEEDFEALEARVDALEAEVAEMDVGELADLEAIEYVIRTQVWAMDEGDMEAWLDVFSNDITYTAYNYGNDTQLIPIPVVNKQTLQMFAQMGIFGRSTNNYSTLSNLRVDVTGDTATAQDYYVHYENPINPMTQQAQERARIDGMHYYELGKENGEWKITELKVVTFYKDPIIQEMEQLWQQAMMQQM